MTTVNIRLSTRNRRVTSFLAVGLTCFVIQLAAMTGLHALSLSHVASNALAFVFAAQVKFVLSRSLVWADRGHEKSNLWRSFISFNGTTGVAFLVNTVVFAETYRSVHPAVATALGVASGTLISYFVCDRLIFRQAVIPLDRDLMSAPVAPGDRMDTPVRIPRAIITPLEDSTMSARTSAVTPENDRLWLVVPAYNEELRLGPTLDQYRQALGDADRLIVVVNGSTDGTEAIARAAASADDRLTVLVEPRKVGKGGAILIGLRHVATKAENADVVAYTDADAAVSGTEISRFCADVPGGQLRVGSRWQDSSTQLRRQTICRQIASRCFNRLVRGLLSLDLSDTQCAAKAFSAQHLAAILQRLDCPGFGFDVDLILAGRSINLEIAEVPVLWVDQKGSTVSLRRAVPAMVREVLMIRRKYQRQNPALLPLARTVDHTSVGLAPISLMVAAPLALSAGDGRSRLDGGVLATSSVGASVADPGPGYASASSGLRIIEASASQHVLSREQKLAFLLIGLAIAAGVVASPVDTLVSVNAALILFFSAANLMKLDLIRRAVVDRRATSIDPRPHQACSDDSLPMYTILLPVYHESALLQQLVDGITALDYPVARLDVKLILEDDDLETRAAVGATTLPSCFEVVLVPDIGPTGKPRACNAGLNRARGEFLVIYDAEDRPERDQLRKSVAEFREAPQNVVCLQAKLNYFNRTYNLLTRWFAAEYSLWFDQLLPGLQSMDVAIPLGGTSNHFRTARLRDLGGWDPFNVTEDADLGLRIYLAGYKTAMLNSTTYEEATSRSHNWVRQRSRWVKGYMQTYLAHMRHPIQLAQQMGPKAFLMLHLFFGAATLCLLVNPFYWALTAVWFATHFAPIETVFPAPLLYLGVIGMFLGNAVFVLTSVSGSYGREYYSDVKWALLSPFYWLMMSVASWKALIQLCYKPFYWEKTLHGYCLYDATDSSDSGTQWAETSTT